MPIFWSNDPLKPLPANSSHDMRSKFADHGSTTSFSSYESKSIYDHSVAQTQYVDMLLSLDSIPRSHNILAAFSTWILLAGFLIVPGTFTNVKESSVLKAEAAQNEVAKEVIDKVQHLPLLWIAVACCAIGCSGLMWLWWRWRKNYVWLINKIFMVLALNALAGLISTLINVYSQQAGKYSVTAKITVVATGSCTVLMALLFLLYNNWVLESVKRSHRKEIGG